MYKAYWIYSLQDENEQALEVVRFILLMETIKKPRINFLISVFSTSTCELIKQSWNNSEWNKDDHILNQQKSADDVSRQANSCTCVNIFNIVFHECWWCLKYETWKLTWPDSSKAVFLEYMWLFQNWNSRCWVTDKSMSVLYFKLWKVYLFYLYRCWKYSCA
jgi:hypothetical protein